FFAGDEFGNTQFGNNNAYCQDNEISWLDWSLTEKNHEILEFFRFAINIRNQHPIIREDTSPCSLGFPYVSLHGTLPWKSDYDWSTKMIGILYAGYDPNTHCDDVLYLGINTYWETLEVTLPKLNDTHCW